jgi:flagellar hook-associated protein 1 FlgK
MSLVSLLSIARTALLAHSRAMSVTGHNVANANTPGYSRQRVDLVAATPLRLPSGLVGRGVDASTITRFRDRFFDATFRRETGQLGRSTTLSDMLSQVETAVGEPSDQSVGAAMDAMFASFGDLSNDPSSATNRGLVIQAANRLVNQMHSLDASLATSEQDALERMQAQVDQVNQIASQIAQLNVQILSAGGGSAPDLQDQRDVLVDQLSNLVNARAIEHPDGTIAVQAGDVVLVDASQTQPLTVRPVAGGGFGVGLSSGVGTFNLRGGSLQALVELSTTTLPGYRASLDQLAQALVTEVNAIHTTGYTLNGTTGVAFFDPAGTTAGTIGLSAAVSASPDNIAAGATNAPGDGAIALQLSDLAAMPLASLGGVSLREHWVTFASDVGFAVMDADQQSAIHQSMVDQADAQRQSVSGVSIDEEMVTLIAQQHAYTAASRLVTVANEMMDDIMKMV